MPSRFISGFVQDLHPAPPHEMYSEDAISWNFRPYPYPHAQAPHRAGEIKLHSLLAYFLGVEWDLDDPLYLRMGQDFELPAADPPCSKIAIDIVFEDSHSRRFPNNRTFQTIHIVPEPDGALSYISIGNALEEIYQHFQMRLRDEKTWRFALEEPLFREKFSARVDKINDETERENERMFGPRWIDFINYFTGGMGFPGLNVTETGFGACRAELLFNFEEAD